MKIISLFTHPYIVPNLHEFLTWIQKKEKKKKKKESAIFYIKIKKAYSDQELSSSIKGKK